MAPDKSYRPDLDFIRERVRQKRRDYIKYDFSRIKNDILKAFFDLVQEYDSLQDYFRICVSVPLESLKVESRLFLIGNNEKELELVCDSINGVVFHRQPVPAYIRLTQAPYEAEGSYIVPIMRKSNQIDGVPPIARNSGKLLGMFEVYPISRLTESDRFFFSKYTNRIGYNLHNRQVAQQNIRHLKFINNLVRDIEHNVITPNIYFKHIFNQLKKRISELEELQSMINMHKHAMAMDNEACSQVMDMVAHLHQDLSANHKELMEYHATTSLFLESLFRRDHFEQGHLVLRSKKCLVEKEIIEPQLIHYKKRFEMRGIQVERPKDMQEEEIPLMVDLGLLSQVYLNLFSNAVKYTNEIVRRDGSRRKAVAYGREYIVDYFGPSRDGIKFNVFSTGPHLSLNDSIAVFKDGYRGINSLDMPGAGHGLSFVKHVVEIHGGETGYEPTEEGNNFFFVLPLHDVDGHLAIVE
ncbi:MAG: ATP-binding protein [Deltaproteobacteria bacterium RIFOXYD12_FULL_50_9]|nr:MAG: ATP-binding protein [Deltaproteobacteria bacterium RIFOXYD12_FULL_50_9]